MLDRVRWQLALLQFIEYRFQPAVQVTNSELGRSTGGSVATGLRRTRRSLRRWKQIRPELEKIVRQRLTDSALDRWLGEARTQNTILYHEGYQ